ncbi:MAG: efflux RND transporter periplasmic adaptor subunit [Gammaproteobacteria bacterium]|nr:efflux RND transporter periplasmic adaptor subunit [Gammaproteobacteria bacterium]
MMKIKYFLFFMVIVFSSSTVVAEEYDAVLAWTERVELGVLTNGVIKQVAVNTGQRVKKDQLLLKLDERVFVADVKHAQSDVKKTQEMLTEAKHELDRVEELYNRTVSSETELVHANLGYTKALAEEKKAQAVLARKRSVLKYSAIHAPFDGVVLARNVSEGQTVISTLQSQPMITMAATGRMLARITVDLEKSQHMTIGKKAEIKVNGKTFNGSVYFVGLEPASFKDNVAQYNVDVGFSDFGETLRAGQKAKVLFP